MKQINLFFLNKDQFNILIKYFPLIILFLILPISSIVFKIPFKKIYHNFGELVATSQEPLTGRDPLPKPKWSFQTMLNGQWQKDFENWFNEQLPMRIFIIRFHNQLFYQFFSKIYMYDQTIIVGKHHYLFFNMDIEKYCNFYHYTYHPIFFKQWGDDLQAISKFFEKKGKKFIYIISPTKASYFHELFPDNYACSTPNPRPEYSVAIETLKNRHINYIDATEIILKNKPNYGNFLFSKGGGHWTELAGAIVAKELIKKISADFHQPLNLEFSFQASHAPAGRDVDLISITNLLFLNQKYLIPLVAIYPPPNPVKQSRLLSFTFIGDSFAEQIINGIQRSGQFDSTNYYFYFSTGIFKYPINSPTKIPMPKDDNYYQNLLKNPIVVIEENESCLQRCSFIHELAVQLSKME